MVRGRLGFVHLRERGGHQRLLSLVEVFLAVEDLRALVHFGLDLCLLRLRETLWQGGSLHQQLVHVEVVDNVLQLLVLVVVHVNVEYIIVPLEDVRALLAV